MGFPYRVRRAPASTAKRRSLGLLGLALAFLLAPQGAAGQSLCPDGVVGCDEQSIDWSYRNAAFEGFDFDTGWVPSGSPLQIRVEARLAGGTEVDVGASPATYWPPPLTMDLPGRPESGRLAFGYGFEFHVYFRFDVTVAGIRYTREQEIDIPSVPMDLLLAAEGQFDPFLYPPATPFSLMDSTESIPLLNADLGSLISLPAGAGGGFRLDVAALLEAAYHTVLVDIEGGDELRSTEDRARFMATSPEGFGPSRDVVMHPEGVLDYTGSLQLAPVIFLEIAGRRFDLPVGPFAFELVNTSTDVVFDDETLHVPLPDIELLEPSVDFGEVQAGETASQTIRIDNEGEAELVLMLTPPGDVSASMTMLTIPRLSRAVVDLTYAPTMVGTPLSADLLIRSNDPDAPRLTISLTGSVTVPPDAGMPDAGFDGGMDAGMDAAIEMPGVAGGACGCRAAGSGGHSGRSGLFIGLFLVAFAGWRRRPRRG